MFSLNDKTLAAIPPLDTTLAAAKALIDAVPSWKRGKSYHGVKTCSTHTNGLSWHARTSVHSPDDGTFQEFWNCLGVDHSLHEQEYIPEIYSAVLLGSFGSFQAWSMGYKFTPPISNRTFTFLITSVLEEAPVREGYVISLPLDVSVDDALKSKEPKGVRGRYISVERIRQLGDSVEWTMATVSNAGGMIPSFLSESQMPSKISQDVPHVLQWLKRKRDEQT